MWWHAAAVSLAGAQPFEVPIRAGITAGQHLPDDQRCASQALPGLGASTKPGQQLDRVGSCHASQLPTSCQLPITCMFTAKSAICVFGSLQQAARKLSNRRPPSTIPFFSSCCLFFISFDPIAHTLTALSRGIEHLCLGLDATAFQHGCSICEHRCPFCLCCHHVMHAHHVLYVQ